METTRNETGNRELLCQSDLEMGRLCCEITEVQMGTQEELAGELVDLSGGCVSGKILHVQWGKPAVLDEISKSRDQLERDGKVCSAWMKQGFCMRHAGPL